MIHFATRLRIRGCKPWILGCLSSVAASALALDPLAPATGSWNYTTGNGNWSETARWTGAIPNTEDAIAEFLVNITANRTITVDGGVGSNVMLGGIRMGDLSGGNSYTISGGTITLQASEGNAFITKQGKGGNDTISSALVLNSALDVLIADTNSNSQGLSLTGKISGGTTGQATINLSALDTENFVRHLLLNNINNDFAGQIVVNSGLLRLEGGARGTSNPLGAQAAGLRGVGNEVIIGSGGRVDLRDSDYDVQADDTEIFIIEGAGMNGLGALVNTSSTATLSHLELSGDATVGGYSTIEFKGHRNQANTADIAAVLDLRGNDFTKIGTNTFIIGNADIRNTTGAAWNIHEGTLQFRNRGGLQGGGQIGSTLYGNNLDGMTVNIGTYEGTYDGVDLTNGSRTSDPFNPNRTMSDTSGNAIASARISFRTDWATGNTHAANVKVVENYNDMTFNLSNGGFVREGNTEAGRTFDHIFNTGTTFNLTGGSMEMNIFSMGGGSSGYNSAIGAYDHPGVTEIQGPIDNTSPGNEGTGFTKRGNRELRLTGDNAAFDGDVLVKQNTSRYLPGQYSTTDGAAESQFFSMSLAGAGGHLNQASSITLTRWGSLALLNNTTNSVYASANNNNRLNDGGVLSLRNGILLLETDVTEKNTENFGHVSVDLGTNYLYLDTRAGGQFDGSFVSLDFNDGGILKIYNMNGSHTWGTGAADDRLLLQDTTGVTLVGADSPGGSGQRVIPGLFGSSLPASLAGGTGSAANRSAYTIQNAYANTGSGSGLMTLENGYLRPLTASEYHVGGTPLADSNWVIDRYLTGGNAVDRTNYALRNVSEDATVNSLTIAFNPTSSGLSDPTAARDYLIIQPGKTLTINSGIINFASYIESASSSAEVVIRGGTIDMAGQTAIVNSALSRHDLDANSGSLGTFMPGNSAFLRSNIVNAGDFVKTGRNTLYMDTWNEFTGNVYVSEQSSLVVRHPGALGAGAPGREVVVGGAGNFLLEYGTTINGIDLRVSNSFDTNRVVLRGSSSVHNIWGGNVIMDLADASGSGEFQSQTITAQNNGTLSIYGNLYTANNASISDSDTWNDPFIITTAIGEAGTINFRGQFRDLESGPLAAVGATGDSATRLDRNHSLVFQMRGHDEINVNAFQQWNATGSIFATQGYFRIQYDPAAVGLDGAGFHTDAARAGITQDNQWNQMWLGGPQNFLSVSNISTNAYHGHVMLTKDGQVLNYADRINVSNNNRNHTLTLGGEHTSGTAYIGSADNSIGYRILFQNSNTERDLRFLQVQGGTLVVNARLEDSNTTADSFNASVSMVGRGTVVFNRSTLGSYNVDRWNFMAGTTVWDNMNNNNQFARTRGTGTNAIASVSTWGGGDLVLATPAGSTMRTQTLDGNIYLLNGASKITTNQNTTLTLGASGRTLTRRAGSTLAFLESGNGAVNISATGLSTTANDFLAGWAVYGSGGGVSDWAARDGTTGVKAFAGYANDSFATDSHSNLTTPAALTGSASIKSLRFGVETDLDIGSGNMLTLTEGGLLVPTSLTGNVRITGGSLTSGWAAGDRDLLIHNYGQGTTTIESVIANDGSNKVNLVHAGDGTTVLAADNTFSGELFLNGGVVQVGSDAQLGTVDGALSRIILVTAGSSYSNGTTGNPVTISGGGSGTGGTATFNTSSSTTTTSRVVNNITVTNGGTGYNSGMYVTLQDGTGTNASGWAVLDSGNLRFNGGTLHVTESFELNAARTIFLGADGGTLRVDPGKTLTINGFISGEYNHVYSGNGFTQSNSLGNAWDAASVLNPDIGDLTIDGGGTVVITGAPDGTVRGNMFNTYGGITWINNGVLRLSSAGSSAGAGSLGTHRSRVDGTVIGQNGTLELNTTSDPTIYEWFTLNGMGYEGGGTMRTLGTSRVYRLAGQTEILSDALFYIPNSADIRINESGGDLVGNADIYRKGNGNFRFYGNNPEWTGRFISASGSNLISSVGNLPGLTEMILERNSMLYISAGGTSVDEFRDRIADTSTVTADGYIRMRMDATSGVFSGFEKVGALTVKAGVMGIEYNLGADILAGAPRLQGDYGGWHFSEIIRQPGASVHLRNLDSGTDYAGADFLTGMVNDRAALRVDTAPLTVGSGDGLSGNAPVVPGFFGGTRALILAVDGVSQRFDESYTATRMVTVDTDTAGNHYLRPLKDSEYLTVANPDGGTVFSTSVSLDSYGLTPDQNLRIVGRDVDSIYNPLLNNDNTTRRNSILTLNANNEVNSLSFNSETYILSNRANPNSSATMGGDYTALHLRDDATLKIASGMIQTANFGVLDRAGLTNTGNANLDLRSQINGGKLDMDGKEAHIYVGGFFNRYNTDIQINAYETIDTDNTTLTIASSITNANGLVKTGPGSLILTGENSYTGNTYINHGNLYVRSDFAFGQSQNVYLSAAGGLLMSQTASSSGVDLHVGTLNGNNIALAFEQGSQWGGNIILDNVDSSGSTSYTRNFVPRIYMNSSHVGVITGNIYGGNATLASGIQATESRIFSTYTGAGGILDLRGQIRDTATGALGTLVTEANQNQVLRMEVNANNADANVQIWQQYDASGQIILKRGYLRYMGEGNFYTDAAAASINPDNAMSGFHMGGRGLIASGSGDGLTISNVALLLANDDSAFNLSSWTVGGDVNDPDNVFAHGNWGLGNTTGNSTIGGENRSGEVVFGTGAGSITFTPYTSLANRDLRLYAADGGEVTIRANFVDGGTATHAVNTSITKVGTGQVNLLGSSAGASTVEGVNVLGGILSLSGYDVNAGSRVGAGASLLMGGGVLALEGGQESFGTLTVRAGGSGLAAIGTGVIDIASLGGVSAGGSLHFQSIAGGTIQAGGLAAGARLGSYATFGSALSSTPTATDWAAVNASGQIVAFTGYSVDTLGAGLHTDVQGSALTGGTTGSLRFHASGAAFSTGAVTLDDAGILFTSGYAGGTPFAAGVGITTTGADLRLHNYASAPVIIAGNITGVQGVAFNGTGETVLAGTNTYSGSTSITGASTLTMDSTSRLGSGDLYLNGGTLNLNGTVEDTLSVGITLGGNDGTIRLTDENKVLVIRGLIASEANPVASLTTNPNSGGLRIEGSGTVQFGSRFDGASLVGVVNTYTGLTVLGDGVNPLKISLQGGGPNSTQHTPFGTTESWTDGTIVRNNVTLEFAPQYGSPAGNDQVRYREWIQFGEQAGDAAYIRHTTQRQIAMDGFYNLVGDLYIHTQTAALPNGGASNREFLFLPNEGGITGSGNLIKTGTSTLNLYNSYRDWSGDLDVREGSVIQYLFPGNSFNSETDLLLGDPAGLSTSTVTYRVQSRYGNSDTALDSGRQRYVIPQNISVRDDIKQEIRIGGSYSSEITMDYTGDIYLGSGSTGSGGASSQSHVRFYYEDTTGYSGILVGHQQHVLMNFSGNFSGSNNIMLDANEGGGANDDANDQFVTYMFSGDNSAYTGKLTIGSETGTGNSFDRDDIEIFRAGSNKALTEANTVELRNMATFQIGGNSLNVGGLVANDGLSTSGLYSFTSPTWDPTRQTTADLDAINATLNETSGTLHGSSNGTVNYGVVGNSSAIVENASATPGTLSIRQTGDTVWDVYFRDGVPALNYEDTTAAPGALSLEKRGAGTAVLSIHNDYTGTTLVAEGGLQVGQGGNGQWGSVFQGNTFASTAFGSSSDRAAGSTGLGDTIVAAGAVISGSGQVRGNLVVSGTLSPGDAGGSSRGTLFVGTEGAGDLTINSGSLMSMQIRAASLMDSTLNNGTYVTGGAGYEDYLAVLPLYYPSTKAFPDYFGQGGDPSYETAIESSLHDHVEIGGNLTVDNAQIEVLADSGFIPQAGQVYNLMDWYGVASWTNFSLGSNRYLVGNGDDNGHLNLPDLSAYPDLRWDTGLFTDYGVLVIAVSPEPSRLLLVFAGLLLCGFRRRRNC